MNCILRWRIRALEKSIVEKKKQIKKIMRWIREDKQEIAELKR